MQRIKSNAYIYHSFNVFQYDDNLKIMTTEIRSSLTFSLGRCMMSVLCASYVYSEWLKLNHFHFA